jgi:hypothetical protein
MTFPPVRAAPVEGGLHLCEISLPQRHQGTKKTQIFHSPKNVRILPSICGRFVYSRSPRPDSAKRYENPARRTACRNTDEFPVPITAALIGGLMACPGKGLRLRECGSALCLALECFQGVIFERRDTSARPVCRDGATNKELARKPSRGAWT